MTYVYFTYIMFTTNIPRFNEELTEFLVINIL